MHKITLLFVSLTLVINAYAQDGSLDNTFGSGGKITYSRSAGPVFFECGALQNNGQILAGGNAFGTGGGGIVIRCNDDGSIDQNFASAGAYISAYGTVKRIVVSGTDIYVLSNSNLLKLDASGKIITAFGTNGVVTASGGIVFEELTVSPTSVYVSGNENDTQTAILKYNHKGQAVSNFGTIGVLKFKLESNSSWEHSTGIYFYKDTLYGSTTWASNNFSNKDDIGYVYAVDSNGAFVNSFGTGGKLLVLDTLNDYAGIRKLSFDAPNHFYVGGLSMLGYSFLARINKSSGKPDAAFGNKGVQKLSVDGSQYSSSTVQGDSKPLYVSVIRNSSSQFDLHLIRTDLTGKLDKTFGTAGEVKTSVFKNDFPKFMLYDTKKNKIIVLGYSDDTAVKGIVVRYNGDTKSNIRSTYYGSDDFNVYPNPATGYFKISGQGASVLTDLKIYDITGQSIQFEAIKVNDEIQIRLNAKAGIYVVRGRSNGTEFSKRLIVIGE